MVDKSKKILYNNYRNKEKKTKKVEVDENEKDYVWFGNGNDVDNGWLRKCNKQ